MYICNDNDKKREKEDKSYFLFSCLSSKTLAIIIAVKLRFHQFPRRSKTTLSNQLATCKKVTFSLKRSKIAKTEAK